MRRVRRLRTNDELLILLSPLLPTPSLYFLSLFDFYKFTVFTFFHDKSAGDKWAREQLCYGFEQYIQVAKEMGDKSRSQTSNLNDTIILASDSNNMVE